MIKVGILGGTFDPIHYGHIALAETALSQYGLDRVLVMTGGNPPHKRDREITDARVRHEMVRLALVREDRIDAFDYEVAKTEYSYTAKTLTELKTLYPDWEIYFIIGEDSLDDLPKWYEPEAVCKNAVLLVYPRASESRLDELIKERSEEFDGDIRPINAPVIGISSTDIRSRIKEGRDTKGLISDDVLGLIKEKRLYI